MRGLLVGGGRLGLGDGLRLGFGCALVLVGGLGRERLVGG
jgi:hypothetical protein